MNTEKQRIALAKLAPDRVFFDDTPNIADWRWMWGDIELSFDPLNDLNAMAEVEKVLDVGHQASYGLNLDRLTGNQPIYFAWVTASASVRAEAMLKALGLWEDSK